MSLFYNLGPYDQLKLFSQANARQGRAMVTAIRRISLTLDEQDSNDLAIMGEMITALGASGQPGTDALVEELTNWKSGRELAEKGQYQAATTAYSKTMDLNRDNLAARYDRATALIKLAKYGEALADLNQIIFIAKTAAPPPTSVSTAILTPTSVLAVTGTPLASSAVGTPTGTLLSITAVPTITATSVITSTPGAASSKSRFINTDLIISTVTDTIRESEGLLTYLRDPQNQTTANQDLIVTLGLSSIVQQPTDTSVTPTPTGCSELIVNGGFENQTGWTEVSKTHAAIIATELPHTGKRSAWLGGTDQETEHYIFQEVRLPANASSVKLSYYRLVHKETTGLPGALASEAQFSVVFNTTDGDLVAEVEKLSSRQGDDKWQQKQFDVSRLGGQSLHLSFAAENPRDNVSSMFVDDVSLIACTTGNGSAAPPAAANNSVYIAGTIDNADTGRGIEGAQVFVIKPGLSATQAVADDIIMRDEVITTGTTDAKSYYQTDQAIPIGQTNNLCIVGPGRINLQLYNLDSNGRFGPIPTDARQLYINEGQRTRITVVSDASQLPVTTIGRNQLLPAPGQYYKAVITKIR